MPGVITGLDLQPGGTSYKGQPPPSHTESELLPNRDAGRRIRKGKVCGTVPAPSHSALGPGVRGPQGTSEITLLLAPQSPLAEATNG